MELPAESRVHELLTELAARFPAIETHLPLARIAVNDEYVVAESPLREGDTAVLLPPVSGGRDV